MNGIPSELLKRLRKVLLKRDEFAQHSTLEAVFADSKIEPWKNGLSNPGKRESRVDQVIELLRDKTTSENENVLVLFLCALRDKTPSEDKSKDDLNQLAEDVKKVLCDDGEETNKKYTETSYNPVEFVNRTEELNLVFRSQLPVQYWSISAPAGYGKTWFLCELRRSYECEGWFCLPITIHKADITWEKLVQEIIEKLDGFNDIDISGSSEIRGVDDGQSREHFKHTPHMRGERWRLLDVGCSGNRLRFESCLSHESPKTQKFLP